MTVAGNIVLDHRVVVADSGRFCCLSSRSDDQQTKIVAGAEAGGDEGPVGGDLGLGGGVRWGGEQGGECDEEDGKGAPQGAVSIPRTVGRGGTVRRRG